MALIKRTLKKWEKITIWFGGVAGLLVLTGVGLRMSCFVPYYTIDDIHPTNSFSFLDIQTSDGITTNKDFYSVDISGKSFHGGEINKSISYSITIVENQFDNNNLANNFLLDDTNNNGHYYFKWQNLPSTGGAIKEVSCIIELSSINPNKFVEFPLGLEISIS